jgi:hypothetical protein
MSHLSYKNVFSMKKKIFSYIFITKILEKEEARKKKEEEEEEEGYLLSFRILDSKNERRANFGTDGFSREISALQNNGISSLNNSKDFRSQGHKGSSLLLVPEILAQFGDDFRIGIGSELITLLDLYKCEK